MFEPRQEKSKLELKNLTYKIIDRVSPTKQKIKVVTFSEAISLDNKKFGSTGEDIPQGYLEERLRRIEEAAKEYEEEINAADIENEIREACSTLLLQIRGNITADGDCLIDKQLIDLLHSHLDSYAEFIAYQEDVNKEMVKVLFHTCSWFYTQSKFAKNSQEWIDEFEKLQDKLKSIFNTWENRDP